MINNRNDRENESDREETAFDADVWVRRAAAARTVCASIVLAAFALPEATTPVYAEANEVPKPANSVPVPPGTAMVKGAAMDKNLLTTNLLGHVLTVHQAHRLDNGSILIGWSTRPTEETVKSLGPILSTESGDKLYGEAEVRDPSLGRPWDWGTQPLEIAKWTQDGVQVQWAVLIPVGNVPKPVNSLPVCFNVYTRAELLKSFQKSGQRSSQIGLLLGEVPLPEQSESAAKAYRQVYEQAAAMQKTISVPFAVILTGKNRPLTEKENEAVIKRGGDARSAERMTSTPWNTPSEMTPGQFVENVQQNHQRLLATWAHQSAESASH